MDIETLTKFFMWCMIINGAMLALSAVMFMAASGWVYRMHSKFFPISRDAFNVAIYSFVGFYKIIVIVFNVVPYVALLIVG